MSWNPKLISKEIRLLDNTLSMYSLVSICVFCTQFFDPDSADGISYPQRDIVEKVCCNSNSFMPILNSFTLLGMLLVLLVLILLFISEIIFEVFDLRVDFLKSHFEFVEIFSARSHTINQIAER